MTDGSGTERLPLPARLETAAVTMPGVPETLLEALDRAATSPRAASRGLRFVDLRERETVVSWSTVIERARVAAASLHEAGVGAGERVALVFSTSPEFFDGFFGALMVGAVPVPLYPPVRLGKMDQYDRRTAQMLEAAEAKIVIAEPRVARLLGGVQALYRAPLGLHTFQSLRAQSSQSAIAKADAGLGSFEPGAASPEDLALVQFSSGTTVAPKPVALSHRALLHQAAILAAHWPDTEELEQAGVSWLPLYHDMGLIGCVLPALLRVANLWLIPPEMFLARPAIWLRTLSRTQATISPAPNFAFSLCVDRVRDRDLEGVDLSHWRAALNGAEAVSMDTVRAFSERFGDVGFSAQAMTPVYGLAEAALAVTFSDLDAQPHAVRFDLDALSEGRAVVSTEHCAADGEPGAFGRHASELVSVGQPVPGFQVEIRGPEGELLNEGAEGEVFTAGPSLLTAYLGRQAATDQALSNGWLATGDLGFIHEGALFLTGRKKDTLVLRGRNWSSVPIEELVSSVEGVRTGCVVAVSSLAAHDSRQTGQGEGLWVIAETRVASDQLNALGDACRKAVLKGLGLSVGRFDFVEPGEIPRTSSGKLRRAAARGLAEAGRLKRAGSAGLTERFKRRPAVAAGLALLHSQRRKVQAPDGDSEPASSRDNELDS